MGRLVDPFDAGCAQQGQAAGVFCELFPGQNRLWVRAACHDWILADSLFVRYWIFAEERGHQSRSELAFDYNTHANFGAGEFQAGLLRCRAAWGAPARFRCLGREMRCVEIRAFEWASA